MTGQKLKKKLKALKMSQVEFASKCGVSDVQVSKWINEHIDVPHYAITIVEMIDELKTESAINKLKALANTVSDGHYTICKFTTNYRVGLGTPADRDFIDKMADGNSIEEAILKLLDRIREVAWG
ncbi:Helix-turn-helix [Desulfocicer vacuolatum DSM 3385]|uniref:Helix-turn-helix n=1 Tax=Desulfocicer vacuolatum DSM 3385 TaxID=1121400 RepID=A0A1W2DVP8_9BACT|nr:helix-turn-helix domain-containing protein [Desulfocicer vacuolatum]SMD01605.1 Helix-turn-helix [Desulfocicer vacuolatum DSM 3385]